MRKALLVSVAVLGLACPVFACEPVEGLSPLLEPGSVLLLGEIHGNTQSPGFVSRAVCLALGAGHSVTVALEIPQQEKERTAAFVASDGGEKDRAALLGGPFWTDPYQDGRRSQAMLALIDNLRSLRKAGKPLRLVLLDTIVPPADGRSRDHAMADNLKAAFDASPKDVLIALTGNLHSRVTLGSPWDPKYEPMGYFFIQAKPAVKVTALDVAFFKGTSWTCDTSDRSSCKVRELGERGDDKGVRVIMHPLKGGFHGVYNVGPLTASLPAVESTRPAAGPK